MTVTTKPPDVRIDVAPDAREAKLTVPADLERFRVTLEHCQAQLDAAGVERTDTVERAVRQIVHRAQQTPLGETIEATVATARAPRAGRDGWVEWHVDAAHEEPELDPESDVCHYSRSAFTLVTAGEVIGRNHPPTPGEPGRDVTGQAIDAADGQPAELELDDSIDQADDGTLTARVGGVLVREGSTARVETVLRVESDVDFSTGNVAFDGDVVITGGVRDRFLVRASGHVEVHGLIEAATIEAGGDLRAQGGFAGRERGNAYVTGHLVARYLNHIFGTVGGDLVSEREIMNSELTVHGRVRAQRGAIIGGSLNVTGPIDVGLLGAPAGTPTELIVGRVPRLEPLRDTLNHRLNQIKRQEARLEKDRRHIEHSVSPQSMSPKQAQQRLQAITDELETLRQARARAEQGLERLHEAIERERTVRINVEKRITKGVTLVVRDRRFVFSGEVSGPIEIRCRDGEVVYRQGNSESRPLMTLDVVSERDERDQ